MTCSNALQESFVFNLMDSLGSSTDIQSSKSYLYDEINSVFIIDQSLNEASIKTINNLISTLCTLPKGIKLLDKLIWVSLKNGFNIVLTKNNIFSTSFPKIEDKMLKIIISIPSEEEMNPDAKVFARLFYDKTTKEYFIKPMTYPLFIILAHEFVHSIHHIKLYELLIEIPNCPSLNDTNEIWENFAKNIYQKANIRFDEKQTKETYQQMIYRILQQDNFKKIFGFSALGNKTDDQAVLSFYWNNNQEDESITIIGDGCFGDNIFLEEARKFKLLNNYQGFEPGSIFRWGHGNYQYVFETKKEFESKTFNNAVKLLKRFLPNDLK